MILQSTFSLATLLTDIGSVFSSIVDWCGDILDIITGNPLLLIGVIMAFAFVGVSMVRKLLNM